MIRSMTAFASAETETRWGALAFELRSVNHRYLELNPRLPEELRAIEPALRERVAAKLTRGKVDVNLRFRPADVRSLDYTSILQFQRVGKSWRRKKRDNSQCSNE